MHPTELIYFVICTFIILFSQFLPIEVLLPLDNFIVRIIIVILLLYLTGVGPTAGIMGLLAISSMYLERNRRKVIIATKKLDLMDFKKNATVEEASRPQMTVPVNDFDTPNKKEAEYMPRKTSNNFEPILPSINEKSVLTSVYPSKNPDKLYETLGFGHVKGLETVGDFD